MLLNSFPGGAPLVRSAGPHSYLEAPPGININLVFEAKLELQIRIGARRPRGPWAANLNLLRLPLCAYKK